jgi:hypothetical protein
VAVLAHGLGSFFTDGAIAEGGSLGTAGDDSDVHGKKVSGLRYQVSGVRKKKKQVPSAARELLKKPLPWEERADPSSLKRFGMTKNTGVVRCS